MKPNEIPRRTGTGSKGITIELSDVYMFGVRRLKESRTEKELEDYIKDQGVRTLPDMSVAVDPVMTVEQCEEMFRTGEYPEGLGESLGFTMKGD